MVQVEVVEGGGGFVGGLKKPFPLLVKKFVLHFLEAISVVHLELTYNATLQLKAIYLKSLQYLVD